ncbi:MAG: cytochrome b/b6 domain-containing protein [Roseiarcus sp.]
MAQIALHWTVALLVVEQYATSGAILRTHAYRPLGKGPDPLDLTLHAAHTRVGLLIFGLVALRVALRALWGAPAWAGGLPLWRRRLATGVQYSLYGALLAQAATGAVTSYIWWPMSAAHRALFFALLVLLAAHLAGATLSLASRPRETLYRITGLLAPGEARPRAEP